MRRSYQGVLPYQKRVARGRKFQPTPVPMAGLKYTGPYLRNNLYRPVSLSRSNFRGMKTSNEIKGVDTDVGGVVGAVLTTTNTNGDTVPLNLIQQGAGSWNRVGRKTHLKSVRITGRATLALQAAANVEATSILRMVLIWDKQPSGAAIPAWDVIFGQTDQLGAETSNFLSPPRYDNMDRFRVLRDIKIHANSANVTTSTTTTGIREVCIDEFVKLPALESVYSGQSNPMTIADISTGALYIAFRQSNSTYGGWQIADPTFARVRYFD